MSARHECQVIALDNGQFDVLCSQCGHVGIDQRHENDAIVIANRHEEIGGRAPWGRPVSSDDLERELNAAESSRHDTDCDCFACLPLVTLNGRPAQLVGMTARFPRVVDLETGLGAEWSHEAIAHVLAHGGDFRS